MLLLHCMNGWQKQTSVSKIEIVVDNHFSPYIQMNIFEGINGSFLPFSLYYYYYVLFYRCYVRNNKLFWYLIRYYTAMRFLIAIISKIPFCFIHFFFCFSHTIISFGEKRPVFFGCTEDNAIRIKFK